MGTESIFFNPGGVFFRRWWDSEIPAEIWGDFFSINHPGSPKAIDSMVLNRKDHYFSRDL